MNLKEQIQKDFIETFKAKDEIKSLTLKLLRAEIKNAEIKKQDQLDDEEVIQVLTKEVKKRKEAMEIYEKAGRGELAEKERAEIEVLFDLSKKIRQN